jgi:hypothetical protein
VDNEDEIWRALEAHVDPDYARRGFQDHAIFCRASLTVETEKRELVPMILSPGQVRLREAIKKQRDQERPVRILYLKSRRIQATTGTAAEFFHSTGFRAGVHTVVLAHDETSVQNIFSIYERFHNKYKVFADFLRLPKSRVLSDRIYYEYGGDPESSFIQIHTAGNANFGRSFRITNVHFSEFPYYQDPGGTLAAVMSAVPKLPETTAIVEGTAKSIGDYFHKMWQASMDPSGESEWLGIFMGWWEHPTNRMPLAVPPDRFQESMSAEEREIKQRYNLSLEQLAWRRWTIHNDFNGDMTHFRREHPATPEEAFSANSRNRFSIPHVSKIHFPAGALCGELEVEDVGAGEKRLALMPNEHGALRVWRRPEKGRLYVLGADCAQGLDINEGDGECDPDFSVGQVLDRDTGEQCAVLRARMMPGETGRYMARLGKWFNMAQICGEVNPGGGGVSMLEAILNADYPSGLIYHRPVTADQDPQVRGDRIGWSTSGVSRPILISLLDETIRQLAITLHCPITVGELMTFVIKANGKAEHQKGCHDDAVIALALAMVAITRMPRPMPVDGGITRRQVSKYGVSGDPQQRGERVRLYC